MVNIVIQNNSATELRSINDVLEHALLTAWLDVSGTGLCVINDKSIVVMLNKAACELLDVRGHDMLGEPLSSLMQGLELSVGALLLMETEGFDGEKNAKLFKNLASHHLLLKFRSVRVADGTRYKVLSITDITSAMLAQEQLAHQRRMWEAMNAGVVISDARIPDMPVVYVNSFFEQMSGYSSNDMVGKNCRHLQGNDVDQPDLENIRTAIRLQTNGYAVLRNYRKDGSMFVNELFVSPIRNKAGIVTHFMGIQHLRKSDFKAGDVA